MAKATVRGAERTGAVANGDVIKIDRFFIEHIPGNPDDVAIAAAVIALAKSLQLTVVAEGVETQEQLNFLRRHGCDTAQGHYYARPLPAEEFVRFLREDRRYRGQ